MHVVLAGGGTAGHIEPALATADALRRRDPQVGITLLGTQRGLETQLVPERGYELALIPPVPLPRRPSPDLAKLPWRVRQAVRESMTVLTARSADVLVGFGGYVALPAYLAARRVGVPIVVHEANARPGLANRVGARLTSHVAVATPDTPLRGAVYVGMPLRRSIATLDRAALRDEARAFFGLAADRPTVLVFGGSQGAQRINEAMAGAARDVVGAGVQVLHAVGRGKEGALSPPSWPVPYVVVPYLDRMDLAYAAADLAICRAGMMTCAELTAVGLPAIYVPLPHGNGEQRLNAAPIVQAGGGLIVDNAGFTPAWVRDHVTSLVADSERLTLMGKAAAGFGRRDADERLVEMIRRAASNDGGSA